MDKRIIVPNAECAIKSFKEDNSFTKRLIQMGVLPGSHLKIIRVGPMGETIEVIIDQGESIALRSEELSSLDCELTAIPLSALTPAPGKKYRIKEYTGGIVFRQKMKERKLSVSDIIEIIGPPGFKLKLENNKTFTLGRGEAEKFIVEPIKTDG